MYNGQSEIRSSSNLHKQNKQNNTTIEYSRPRQGSYNQYKQQRQQKTTLFNNHNITQTNTINNTINNTNYAIPNMNTNNKKDNNLYSRRNSISYYDGQINKSRKNLDIGLNMGGLQKYGSRDITKDRGVALDKNIIMADRYDRYDKQGRDIRQRQIRDTSDIRRDITSRYANNNDEDYAYVSKLRVKNYDDVSLRENYNQARLTDRYRQKEIPYQRNLSPTPTSTPGFKQLDKNYIRYNQRPQTTNLQSLYDRKKSMPNTNLYQQQQYYQADLRRGVPGDKLEYKQQQYIRDGYDFNRIKQRERQRMKDNFQEAYNNRNVNKAYMQGIYDTVGGGAGAYDYQRTRKRQNLEQSYSRKNQKIDDIGFITFQSKEMPPYGSQRIQYEQHYQRQKFTEPIDSRYQQMSNKTQQNQYYSKGIIRPNLNKPNSAINQTSQTLQTPQISQRQLGYVPSRNSFRTEQYHYASKSQNITPTKTKNVYEEIKYQQEPLDISRRQQLISKSKMLKDKLNQLSADSKKLIISGPKDPKDIGRQNNNTQTHQQRLDRLKNAKDRLYQSPFKDSTSSSSNLRTKFALNSFQTQDPTKKDKYTDKSDLSSFLNKQKSQQMMRKVNLFTKQEIGQSQQNKKSSHIIPPQSQSMTRINSLNNKINQKINSIISAYGK